MQTVQSKSYELPLARDYVRHWGVTEAVRELLQNMLDSESPNEFSIVGHHPLRVAFQELLKQADQWSAK